MKLIHFSNLIRKHPQLQLLMLHFGTDWLNLLKQKIKSGIIRMWQANLKLIKWIMLGYMI